MRLCAGVQQKDLAGQVGIHPSTLGSYERGETSPDLETLGAILDSLGLDLADLGLAESVVAHLLARLKPVEEHDGAQAGHGDLFEKGADYDSSSPRPPHERGRTAAEELGDAVTRYATLLMDRFPEP